MKIVTVIGARPQFIKASSVSRAIQGANEQGADINEIIIHTGQHFDTNMSQVFFEELAIPTPSYHLSIGGMAHGAMTGRMLEAVESVLLKENPDVVLVYGDTNSTLAGALAAAKLHIRVAHVEAGLRSFNKAMPEEVNRILTDHISDFLFCPTQTSVNNLQVEGIRQGVRLIGDVMYDATLYYRELARNQFSLDQWGLKEKQYALCTLHRAENTDNHQRLKNILTALGEIASDIPIILPLHPRTRNAVHELGWNYLLKHLTIISPLSYLRMLRLEMSAQIILTDSGGVQKEAFFHQVPCITLRDETEWVETVHTGWNVLAGADRAKILRTWRENTAPQNNTNIYGEGKAAINIVRTLNQSNLFFLN